MKRFHLFVIALMPISLFGCRATFAFGQPVLTFAGVVAESSTHAGEYAFSNFDQVRLGRSPKPIHAKLPLATLFGRPNFLETEQVVKVHVKHQIQNKFYDYDVLLGRKLCLDTGPRFCQGHTAKGHVEKSHKKAPHKKAPVFHVDQGWAFLWTNPSVAVAETKWIIGATTGSTMVVQIVDDTKERFYFLEGNEATVTCNKRGTISTPVTFDSSDQWQYIDVTYDQNDCKFSEKKDIIGAPKVFIDEVKQIATAADWPPGA